MKLVIVESPAKAKTIGKYLGENYQVIASFGHVRDLPSKNGSVIPEDNFAMKYEIPSKCNKYVDDILAKAKRAQEIYLATDPDREGEAIAWHVAEILKQNKVVNDDNKFKRITFNEITKRAVLQAVEHPRSIDYNLVNAQQARRALDYLVGFTVSPILWRKLPGCRSAGRVQSVALRMISVREEAIEHFKSEEYWDIKLDMLSSQEKHFIATLTHAYGTKLEKLSLSDAKSAEDIVKKLTGQSFVVTAIQRKQQKRSPAAPFITSSLQQEASRKLGFNAKKTMQIAQKLYEGVEIAGETVGLITYMRTDGVTISTEAVHKIRALIQERYGDEYLPTSARIYKTKLKNAQEAHEAIRPTDINLLPDKISQYLSKEYHNLYALIWSRTVACQMENTIVDMVGVDMLSDDRNFMARATGSTMVFDGFYKIYHESQDDASQTEDNKTLPPLFAQEKIVVSNIKPAQHFTQPLPRYSEASLVKQLEEMGIGRPSTYATIISVLQERNYVTMQNKRFYPSDLGRLVTAFLLGFFNKYVEYDFTADMETNLDKISSGEIDWKDLLSNFWLDFIQNVNEVSKYTITEVIDYVAKALDFYLFGEPGTENYQKNKQCVKCINGTIGLKLGKYGAFLACSRYPDCDYKKQISRVAGTGDVPVEYNNDKKELGEDASGNNICLKKGPFGWYVQLTEAKVAKTSKPKRCPIPASIPIEEVTLAMAIMLLNLPLLIGHHSATGQEIYIGIGRYGPYLKYMKHFITIPKTINPLTLNLSQAEQLVDKKVSAVCNG